MPTLPSTGTAQISAILPTTVTHMQCPHCQYNLDVIFNYALQRKEFYHDGASSPAFTSCPNRGNKYYLNGSTVTKI